MLVQCTCIYIGILEASNEAVQIKCSLLNVLITASFFTFIRDFFQKSIDCLPFDTIKGAGWSQPFFID